MILGKKRTINLRLLYTPGHSPGSLSVHWPENKVLIPGDVIFYGSIGRTDFTGGSITLLGQSIEKLSKLDVNYLLPGHSTDHGSIVEGKENVERNL